MAGNDDYDASRPTQHEKYTSLIMIKRLFQSLPGLRTKIAY